MALIPSRLEALQAWGVDLGLIRHSLRWSPTHRLEIMEGIIQVELQLRQQTLDPHHHAAVLRLHFTSPLPLLAALAPLRTIVIGRFAGVLQGVPSITYTLDLGYAQDEETVQGIIHALAPFAPQPQLTPNDLRQDHLLPVDTSLVVVRLFPTLPGLGSYLDALSSGDYPTQQRHFAMEIANRYRSLCRTTHRHPCCSPCPVAATGNKANCFTQGKGSVFWRAWGFGNFFTNCHSTSAGFHRGRCGEGNAVSKRCAWGIAAICFLSGSKVTVYCASGLLANSTVSVSP